MSTIPEPDQELIDEFVGSAHSDLERVKNLLQEYPAMVNATARWKETAIQAAAQTGRVDIAELLLSAGAALDICTAAMLGLSDEVEDSIQSNPAQTHAQGAHGLPLLYFPILHGHLGIAAFLLEHGADINAGEGGNTPLHGAVLFGQSDCVQWLLEKGADPNLVDYNGKTALDLALGSGQDDIAGLIRDYQTV